ncbi:hypothetical protein MP638_002716 [Amoeboaphelidium occidentale]|nr:hypothetical protein MP638_002716 [Amoeboaphelidium occidentale]
MKALVQEMVLNFRRRLSTVYDGLQVRELTGDQSMTQQEINQTQIIVTTPEKFDIVTRKSPYYMEKLRLVIIDEIHLLHDERGHVLESLVSRMLRYSEDTQQNVRLVGLSATLPNYMDVSIFLRTAADSVFYFDASYRPCPLKQAYIGVTSQGISKRAQVMNKVCYEKCLQQCARQNQVLVFVHSRKDTHRTAQQIRDLAISEETLGTFLPAQSESRRVLEEEIENVHSKELRDLLPYGFAIHHAGMNRGDRQLVEDLFADGHVKVLVSTATLAWGVNLPAHCVIIKGTKVYNPEKGEYTELSIQDVLQMFGRAGRPQYDTYGEAIIITSQDEVLFYLSLINTQLPIESQLVSRLPDALNAEVVLNTVKSLNDAVEWLGYSYLYVRMLRNPELYGISAEELKNDPKLVAKRSDLAHTALLLLEKSHLVKYDHRSKQVQPTEMGRIASHYYVTYKSMFTYLQQLKPWMNLIDILRVFSMSDEFRLIPIRPEEKVELERLLERVPVPVKDPLDESNVAKINVLLQAYISQLKLDGFALLSDMVYVQQSASRILRAMFEIALKRDWAELSHKLLDLCQMVEHRQWSSMSVLRQTPRPNLDSEQMRRVPLELVKKIEKTNIPYERLFDLNEAELGELVRNSKAGKLLYQAIHVLPKVEVEVRVMPITRTMIKLEISLNPTFNPVDNAETMDACLFWVLVEDASGQQILHKSQVLVRPSRQVFTECYVSVPNIGNISNIFVSLVPDRLLGLETRLAISFRQLILPSKFLPPTELVDLSPATPREVYLKLKQQDRSILKYSAPGFDNVLNSVINNCVKPVLFGSKENEGNTLLVCTNNNDLNVVAELFIAKEFQKDHCVLYCCENTERAFFVASRLEKVFHEEKKLRITIDASLFGSKSVAANVSANVLVSTYKDLDIKLKRMMKDKNRIPFACVVCEDIDLMGQDYKIETALSRLMRICEVDEAKLLCLSKSITTSKELSEFLKISSPANALNFGPNIRDLPLEIHLNGVNNNSYYTNSNIDIVTTQLLQSASVKNLLRSVLTANNDPENEKMIMFFPSKRQIKLVLNDIIRLYDKTVGVKNENDNMDVGKVENSVLQNLLKLTGDEISFVYEGLSTSDVNHCNRLFVEGKTKILLCTKPVLQKLYYSGLRLFAPIVAILGTSYYEPLVELRNKEYSVHDLYEMILFSQPCLGDPSPLANDEESGTAKLYLYSSSNSAFYKKFLFEGIPVESCLDLNLHNFVLDELISLGTVSNRQEAVESLSNSFYYKRLSKNPNYYNLYLQSGVTHLTRALVNEKLSELVETTFDELSNSKLIVEESEDMEERYSPLNLGLIASHYNIDYVTIDVYSISLNRHSKMKSILEVLAFSNEFIQTVPVREDELYTFYSKYCSAVPLKVASDDMNAGIKTFTLYQCYFSRFNLPSDLKNDLHSLILPKTLNHLYAIIDVLSSNSHLAPTLLCMELCQMIVQAQWDKDSPLLQLPHFTHNLINSKCKKLNIETIFDLLEYINSLDEGAKNEVFEGLSAKQIQEIADICNAYPNIETKFQVSYDEEQQDEDACDEEENEIPFTLDIELSKDVEEEDEIEEWVTFKHYQPDTSKQISRWLVVGSMQTKELLSIKRFSFNAKNSRIETVQDEDGEEEAKCVYRTKLTWSLNKEIFEQVKKGEDKLKLYLMSDSWVGCDQEYDIEL